MCCECEHGHEQRHPTVDLRGVQIDERLAPLINIIWNLGIRTDECCQEIESPLDVPVAMIGFEDLAGAATFVRLLAAANPDYCDDFEYLSDCPSDNGFRIYVWFQGSVGTGLAQLFPSVVLEIPTDLLDELTKGVLEHLSSTGLGSGMLTAS